MTDSRKALIPLLPLLGLLVAGAALRDLPAQPAPVEDSGIATADAVRATRSLRGEVLHQSESLALPMLVEVAGDRLIVTDDYADHHVRVLRRSDGAVERSFGPTGRGPREFETIFSVDVVDPSGELLIHDPTLQRVTRVDLARDFDGGRWVSDRTFRLNANAVLIATMWTPDGLIGLGATPSGRLAHLSPEGRLLRLTGELPVDPKEAGGRVWSRAMQARLKPHPDRTRWAVVSRYADRLEIYDAGGQLMALGDRPYDFGPQDLREEDPMAVRFGYIDVATTDARIYALFSGRVRGEGKANLGDRIHVFDWDGRLVDVWEVDDRLISVAVTPDGDELYGVRHEPLPAVVHYTLD
jgi:hypothetical protein